MTDLSDDLGAAVLLLQDCTIEVANDPDLTGPRQVRELTHGEWSLQTLALDSRYCAVELDGSLS